MLEKKTFYEYSIEYLEGIKKVIDRESNNCHDINMRQVIYILKNIYYELDKKINSNCKVEEVLELEEKISKLPGDKRKSLILYGYILIETNIPAFFQKTRSEALKNKDILKAKIKDYIVGEPYQKKGFFNKLFSNVIK